MIELWKQNMEEGLRKFVELKRTNLLTEEEVGKLRKVAALAIIEE